MWGVPRHRQLVYSKWWPRTVKMWDAVEGSGRPRAVGPNHP
jgi:hypothetical protein